MNTIKISNHSNMDEIKTFIEDFTKQEAEALYLMLKPNIIKFNEALQKMNGYCIEDLHDEFGMVTASEPESPEFYERWSTKKYPNSRRIYKISYYSDETYDDVYVAYTSVSDPTENIFSYWACLFVTETDDELKIVRHYTFGDPLMRKNKFQAGSGLGNISFKTLKKPVAIERYIEPKHDKDGMEHYNKDI